MYGAQSSGNWNLPPGRDLRRAYDGSWIIDGDTVYLEAMKQGLLISRRDELQRAICRLIQDESRRMRLRRVARNHW